jgi:hypothetical protein
MKWNEIFPYASLLHWFLFILSIFVVLFFTSVILIYYGFKEEFIFASIIGGVASSVIIVLLDSIILKGFGVKEIYYQRNLRKTIREEIDSQETVKIIKQAVKTSLLEKERYKEP